MPVYSNALHCPIHIPIQRLVIMADARYGWLNNVIAVGTGEQTAAGPVYSILEIG
jgi:hypothetical protein